VYFKDLVNIFYNSTVPCVVEFVSHLLSDEILLAVQELGEGRNGNNRWEWKENGNKTRRWR